MAEKMIGAVAVVTGGGTGIGRATALAFAREGARVAVNYSRSEREASDTVAEIAALGGRAMAVRADVSRQKDVNAMFEAVRHELGAVSVLVNNAGRTFFVPYGELDSVTEEMWDAIFDTNVKGAFYCSRAAAGQMKSRGGGCIINVASIAGMTGFGSSIPYATSKGALICLTKALARALAPDIRVNAVSPGVVETRWVEGREDFVRLGRETTPMRRNAAPEDVAEVILSLTTSASYVTGANLPVDGGRSL